MLRIAPLVEWGIFYSNLGWSLGIKALQASFVAFLRQKIGKLPTQDEYEK